MSTPSSISPKRVRSAWRCGHQRSMRQPSRSKNSSVRSCAGAVALLDVRHALGGECLEERHHELVERAVAVRGEPAREEQRVHPVLDVVVDERFDERAIDVDLVDVRLASPEPHLRLHEVDAHVGRRVADVEHDVAGDAGRRDRRGLEQGLEPAASSATRSCPGRAHVVVLILEPALPSRRWYCSRYARLSANGDGRGPCRSGCVIVHAPASQLHGRAGDDEPRGRSRATRAARGTPSGREDVGRIAVEVVERRRGRDRESTAGRRTGTRTRRRPPRCIAARAPSRRSVSCARAGPSRRPGSRRRSDTRSRPRTGAAARRTARARGARRGRPGRASFWLSIRVEPSSSTIAESPSGPSAGEVIARIVTPSPSRSRRLAVLRRDEVVKAESPRARGPGGRCRTPGAALGCLFTLRASHSRIEVIAMQVRDVEVVGRLGTVRRRGRRCGNGNHEPKYAGVNHGIAQHRAVTGLHEAAGVPEERDAHRRSFSRVGRSRSGSGRRFPSETAQRYRIRDRGRPVSVSNSPAGPGRGVQPLHRMRSAGFRGLSCVGTERRSSPSVRFARQPRDRELAARVLRETKRAAGGIPRPCARGSRARAPSALERGPGRRDRPRRVRAPLGSTRAFRRESRPDPRLSPVDDAQPRGRAGALGRVAAAAVLRLSRQPVSRRTRSPRLLETQESELAVRAALAELPEVQRRPIEMAYFDGLSYRDVARELDEAEGTVKYRIRMGMQKLRRTGSWRSRRDRHVGRRRPGDRPRARRRCAGRWGRRR